MTIAAGRGGLLASPTDDRDELALLLATGPFPAALRAAIKASNLSLDRIQHRLMLRRVKISVATLSYWQSGRRRPERPESLEALRQLEIVLRVPPASLSALLGPPRPRGRRSRATRQLPIEALWTRRDRLPNLLDQVDTSSDTRLGRISQHDRCEIGSDRTQHSWAIHQVLRAEQDGPDRWVLVYDWETKGAPPPVIDNLHNCTLGNVAVDEDACLLVAELMFDRPLARGETLVMDYRLVNRERSYRAGSDDTLIRKFRLPVREYVVEVQFAPDDLPTSCQQVSAPIEDHEPARRRNLKIAPSGSVHAVALGFGPGMFGLTWDWTD